MPTISIVLPYPLHVGPTPRSTAEREAMERAEARSFGISYAQALQSVAIINANWVLEEWEAGRKPACCAKCHGAAWAEDTFDNTDRGKLEILTTPMLFLRKTGSCGSIAACHTGHKIAEAFTGNWMDKSTRPKMSWDQACARYHVRLEQPDEKNRPRVYHAVSIDDGVRIDTVLGMKKVEKQR